MSKPEVRLGVIGLGNMGTSHIANIEAGKIKGVKLVAVCDIVPSKMDRYGDKYKKFTDSAAMLRSGEIDAVMIETPHYSHTTIGIDALTLGIHTLVEKPISVHKADCQRLIAAHTDPKVVFSAMFNQRSDPHFIKVRDIIKSGQLGELTRINWIITNWFRTQTYYDGGGWRATWKGEGGGVLLNQCPHQLDLLQWLCGLPVRVHAFCHEGKWHDIEVEDDVTAYLEFANGATGVFVTTTADAPGTNRLEITGTKGRVICENDTLVFDRLAVDERTWCATCGEGFAKPACERVPLETDGLNPQHAAVLNAFAAHIATGAPLVADGREGINGLLLSNAIHLSSWTGETVALPFDEQRFLALLNERRARSRHKEDADIVMDTSGSFGSQVR